MNTVCTRLKPGEDLYLALSAMSENYEAVCVVTCVGSLQQVSLRLAGAEKEKVFKGPYEIVSLVGTGCADGVHLHCSVSDVSGQMIGGHLKPGSIIETTAEVVLGLLDDVRFSRQFDEQTGYPELVIDPACSSSL